nr:uncharacterized protein LOC117275574 [Nicotiana tomentosiformis]
MAVHGMHARWATYFGWTSTSSQSRPYGQVDRLKARLVAKGYTHIFRLDYSDTFSPVAKVAYVHLFLSIAIEQFKKELKKQFYPMNVVYEARRKLRELQQMATIREYVREFTSLMLQISSLSEEDFLFYFMDGLQNWAKQELRRYQVANMDKAIGSRVAR